MPEYLYRCADCGYSDYIVHGMRDIPEVCCPVCGQPMKKRPVMLSVNWGGLRPSQGEIHPNIKRVIDDAPRRRDEEVHG